MKDGILIFSASLIIFLVCCLYRITEDNKIKLERAVIINKTLDDMEHVNFYPEQTSILHKNPITVNSHGNYGVKVTCDNFFTPFVTKTDEAVYVDCVQDPESEN